MSATSKAVLGALPLAVLWGLPLALGLAGAAATLGDAPAWRGLFAHPQLWPALGLSVWTGTASTAIALALALWITASRRARGVGWMLALPHLSFAVGFGFLIMPAGWFMRVVSALSGWETPPAIVTNHDPLGLSLIAVLVLKETPFLLWAIAMVQSRSGAREAMRSEMSAALSLGHGPLSVWLRVLWPQLLRRLVWPAVIVWIYGATVIDVALAIGPTAPPPLALVLWRDLNDADAAMNARGQAGALFLAAVLAAVLLAATVAIRLARPLVYTWITRGPPLRPLAVRGGALAGALLIAVYVAVVMVLAVMAIAGPWPFPGLSPRSFTVRWFGELLASPWPLFTSLGLALAAGLAALGLCVLWFETLAERCDRWLLAAAVLALAVPPLLIAAGQYAAFLRLGLTGGLPGLFLVHLTPAFAYALIVLVGPYRGFDPRFVSVAAALGAGRWRSWFAVKARMLGHALAATAATAFAVSFAQFVPAQLIAAGRFSTLPMEAVTLASGGNRPLLAVFALALALPPALAFGLADLAGRWRWSAA